MADDSTIDSDEILRIARRMMNKMSAAITIIAVGPIGSGKSAILGEIEIALRALGVSVSYQDEAAAQAEKNATHADWQTYIDMYKPRVQLVERLDDPTARHLLSGYHQICTEHGIAPSSSDLLAAANRAMDALSKDKP